MPPSRSAKLIEEIAEEIRRRISSGVYAPGQPLKQEEIAAEFKVSRTPIREAISRLEASGLVTQERGRSAVVSQLNQQDIVEAYQIRAELEGLAAQLAARWLSDQHLLELRQAHDVFVKAVTELKLLREKEVSAKQVTIKQRAATEKWIVTNADFHDVIGRASRNVRLQRYIRDLRHSVIQPAMSASSAIMDLHRMETNIRHHEAILAALEARSPARSRQAMTDHILESSDYVVGLLMRES